MSFKTKIKDQSFITGSNLVSALINGVFWLYLATIIDKAEYGEIGFYISIAEMGFSFANFGIAALITVYSAKGEKIFFPAYEFGVISSTILATIIYFITGNLAVSLLVIGSMLWWMLQAKFNGDKEYSNWSKFHLIRKILTVVIALSLVHSFGIDGVIWAFFIATLPSLIGIKKFLKSERVSLRILRSKFSFMTGIYLSGLTTNLFWWGDKTIIGIIFGFSVLADYQLASHFFGLLYTIPASLMIYLVPQEVQKVKNHEFKKIVIFIVSGITIISIISLPFVINSFFPKYSEVITLSQIMLIGMIPVSISIIIESKLLGNEKTRYILYSTGCQTGIYLILILILGNFIGIVGFAVAFLVALCVRTVINVIFARKMEKNELS